MDIFYSIGSEIIIYLQNIGAWLLSPMEIFSFLGDEWFYLFIAPVIYWCVSPSLGLRIGLIMMFSAGTNSIFKFLLHTPRPYWVDQKLISYATNLSFGAPSGHAQNAVVFWGLLAYWVRRTWFWVISIFIILMISISRLYLGVHYPHDTMLGWLVGALILLAYIPYEKHLQRWLKTKSSIQKILLAFTVSSLFLVIGIGLVQITDESNIQYLVSNIQSIPAITYDSLKNNHISGLVSTSAAFFGMSTGAVWISSNGGFNAEGNFWQRFMRFIIGIAGVGILNAGLSYLFPGGSTLSSEIFRYIKYTLLTIWISGGAPFLFLRFNLSSPTENLTSIYE